MSFEIFTRNVVKTGTPSVSITTMGRMALNKAAAKAFEKSATEYVLLMWDIVARKVAIRPIGKKDQRAYKLSGAGSTGVGFSCVTFLNHIGYDWSKTRPFQLEWDEQDGMFVFSVPKEFLGGKPEGQQLQLPRLKRSDRAKAALAKTEQKEARVMTQ
jgi:hypothetical protein